MIAFFESSHASMLRMVMRDYATYVVSYLLWLLLRASRFFLWLVRDESCVWREMSPAYRRYVLLHFDPNIPLLRKFSPRHPPARTLAAVPGYWASTPTLCLGPSKSGAPFWRTAKVA